MNIVEDFPLQNLNSFGIHVSAKYYGTFHTCDDLAEIQDSAYAGKGATLILGGGSNLLFTGNFNGLVLKNEIKGIQQVNEDKNWIYVKAGAGENWHQFVLYCVNNGLGGTENLSLIPGNVGATPIQNIGAYGVELKDIFYELETFHLQEKTIEKFNLEECGFGYRESVFKSRYRNQFVVLNVTYRLSKTPVINTSYGALNQELAAMGVTMPGIREVSEAVMNIRRSKLPDPAITGNAGSFFKNPEVPASSFLTMKSRFPGIVGYPQENTNVKLAAAWLIEQCGWKGYRRGDAGCHAKQALVLVNYGNASGRDIFDLSEDILASVKSKFGVELEREVNVI